MAAVDTATAGGTRRAVIRSERFVQWQQDLSSNRATYGACRRYDSDKSSVLRTYQRKSEDMDGRLRARGKEEKEGHVHDCHMDSLKVRARRQPSQKHEQNLDCQRLSKGINSDHQCGTIDASSKEEACHGGLQQGPLAQGNPSQLPQQEPAPLQTVVRRRRRRGVTESQQPQPSRSPACGTNAAGNLSTRGGSKRSSRLLAQKLAIEKPSPAPLKLPKLQVLLSRKEIQDDWLKITGQRYVGKPKKSVLIQLGLGLCTSLMCPSSIRYLKKV